MSAARNVEFAPEYETNFHRWQAASANCKSYLVRYRIQSEGPSINVQRESRLQKLLLSFEIARDAWVVS